MPKQDTNHEENPIGTLLGDNYGKILDSAKPYLARLLSQQLEQAPIVIYPKKLGDLMTTVYLKGYCDGALEGQTASN